MRKISELNLNALMANQRVNAAIAKAGEQTNEKTVRLAKIILRSSPTHKLKTNVPLYAFVKNAGDKVAMQVLTNGVVTLVDNSQVLSLSEVRGDFTINGITYGKKDTVNGVLRYKIKRK